MNLQGAKDRSWECATLLFAGERTAIDRLKTAG